jgi:periplasmic divalent cation tolerance protein
MIMTDDGLHYSMMFSTTSDRPEAERIAALLVEQGLAACVQLMAIDSVYKWKGKIEKTGEILLLIKTRSDHVDTAMLTIKAAHSYEVPEIIAVPIESGLPEYLAWIDAGIG